MKRAASEIGTRCPEMVNKGEPMTAATQDQALNLRNAYAGIAQPDSRAIAARPDMQSVERIVADARSGTRSRIGVALHTSFADAEISWRAFEAEAAGLGFQTFDLLNAWHSQVGGAEGVEPAIAIVSLDGSPVMLCAFGIERRFGMRCLVWLGGRMADYKAPMLAPDFAARVPADQFAALWEKVRRSLPSHDFISLENQPSHIGLVANPFAALAGDPAPDEGYIFALPKTYEEVAQNFRPSTRRSDRAKERKLAKLGKLEFRVAETSEDARRMTADILDRKAAQLRAQGIGSIFEDAGYRAAYINLAALPPKRKLLQVAELTLDGEFLSGSIAHIRQGHVTLTVHTYEDSFARMSPGRLHLLKLIQESLAEGHTIYDLSVGRAAYKDSLGVQSLPLSNYVISTRPWGLAAAKAERARLSLKRRVKGSDRLMGWVRSMQRMLMKA